MVLSKYWKPLSMILSVEKAGVGQAKVRLDKEKMSPLKISNIAKSRIYNSLPRADVLNRIYYDNRNIPFKKEKQLRIQKELSFKKREGLAPSPYPEIHLI